MYGMWVKRFLDFLGGKPITLENTTKFKEWLVSLEYSPKNIQYGLTLIRDYISYQITMHGLQFPLKLLKIPQERAKSHHAITHGEYLRMCTILPTNHPISLQRRIMLSMLWDTGMRAGELLNLRIADLKGRSSVINNEKNHRSRLVVWSKETDTLLRFYLPLRKNLECGNDYLFVSFKWTPRKKLTTRQLERIFKLVAKKAGLGDDIRPHGMRHGFTHTQMHKKQSMTVIAQMLGHSTINNVMTYTQLSGLEINDAWGLTSQ